MLSNRFDFVENDYKKEADLLVSKYYAAKPKFFIIAGAHGDDIDENYEAFIDRISRELFPDLINVVEDNLTDKQKVKVARNIIENSEGSEYCQKLLQILKLDNVDVRNCLVLLNSEKAPYLPINAVIQKSAAVDNWNHIFAFPVEIEAHFPVFYCHPVFATFSDILNDRIDPFTLEGYGTIINYDIRKNLKNAFLISLELF